MDYKKHYENLIKSRLNRKLKKGVYYEKHHIIPKCWGGSNKKENIIKLTAREHYIAHWLLYRIRPTSNGTALAFWRMTFPGGKFVERNYKISARAYSEAKSAMVEANRKLNTGKKVKKEHLVKWTKNKNNSKMVVNIKTDEEFSNAKKVWETYFKDDITYSNFNYYMRGLIKNNGKPAKRKVNAEKIYEWKYKNDK
jgi:hypothetical protein